MNVPIAYLDGDDLAAIRDGLNERRHFLVDETNEDNNGFQVCLRWIKACQFFTTRIDCLGSYLVF